MSTTTSRYLPPTNPDELVLAWLRRARESQMAHYEMANILGSRGHFLGVPVILIAVVGASVFATITAQVIPTQAKVVVGLFSLLAAVLSSLQTFFKFSERAEKHKIFGARFGAVRRELELLYAQEPTTRELKQLESLRAKLDRLAEEAPHVPAKVFLKVQTTLPYTGESRPPLPVTADQKA